MSSLLEEAIAAVRELPDDDQVEVAESILSIAARSGEHVTVDAQTRAAVYEGIEQADRGEYVSDARMAAFFRRHGL